MNWVIDENKIVINALNVLVLLQTHMNMQKEKETNMKRSVSFREPNTHDSPTQQDQQHYRKQEVTEFVVHN